MSISLKYLYVITGVHASYNKQHLHGILEVVLVLHNEAIAHVSGMQSSCKGCNITACSASCSKHKVKMTSLVASSSSQDSQEHEVSQRGYDHHTILFFSCASSRK